MSEIPGFEPVELAGEWPAGAPVGVVTMSPRDGGVHIDHADPRVVFSGKLIDDLPTFPLPPAWVVPSGNFGVVGSLVKIQGVNRTVIYRLVEWYPSIRAYLGEWVD